jgi:hypothetical protein
MPKSNISQRSLGSYLAKGGIKGRHFLHNFHDCNLEGMGIYRVAELWQGNQGHVFVGYIHLQGSDTKGIYQMDIGTCFNDRVATSAEVRAAKRSRLERQTGRPDVYNAMGAPILGPKADKRRELFPESA